VEHGSKHAVTVQANCAVRVISVNCFSATVVSNKKSATTVFHFYERFHSQSATTAGRTTTTSTIRATTRGPFAWDRSRLMVVPARAGYRGRNLRYVVHRETGRLEAARNGAIGVYLFMYVAVCTKGGPTLLLVLVKRRIDNWALLSESPPSLLAPRSSQERAPRLPGCK
jgi:hypothetical protein